MKILLLGLLVRLLMLAFGAYIDATNSLLPYTDVDYFVFTDAAEFVAVGQSPYKRHTYRYTPLIALALSVFNGKLLFVVCDLAVYVLLQAIRPLVLLNIKHPVSKHGSMAL